MSKGGVEAGLAYGATRPKKYGKTQFVRLEDQISIEAELSALPSFPGVIDWGRFDDALTWYRVFREHDLNREHGLRKGAAAWSDLSRHLEKIADEINNIFNLGNRSPVVRLRSAETLALADFRDQARRLSRIVGECADDQTSDGTRAPRTDFPKGYLYGQAIEIWTACGGQVRTSMTAQGEPDGPLIRYLMAIWSSAAHLAEEAAPTRHAIREEIRKPQRQGRAMPETTMGKRRPE